MVTRDDLPGRGTVDDIFRYVYTDCDLLVDDITERQEAEYGRGHYRKTVPGTDLILMKRVGGATVGERPTAEVSVRGGRFTVKLFTVVAFRLDVRSKTAQPQALIGSSALPTEVHTDIEVSQHRPLRRITWRIGAPTTKQPWEVGSNWGESIVDANTPVTDLSEMNALRIATARQAVVDTYQATQLILAGEPSADVVEELKQKQLQLYYPA